MNITPILTSAIGIIGGICTTGAFIPQIMKVIKTGHTRDISLVMYVVLVTGISLWVIYGIMLGEFPIIFFNSVSFILCSTILIMKIRSKM